VVDEHTMATTVPGIFAGGDAVLGARTVIEAIATANRAAVAIDAYLRSGTPTVGKQFFLEKYLEQAGVYKEEVVPEMVGGRVTSKSSKPAKPVANRAKPIHMLDSSRANMTPSKTRARINGSLMMTAPSG